MLRCAKIISVEDTNENNEKLIRCYAVSFDHLMLHGARAMSAVKFGGISETHYIVTGRKYQGHTEGIPVAILAYTGVYCSLRLHHNGNTDIPLCAGKTRVEPLVSGYFLVSNKYHNAHTNRAVGKVKNRNEMKLTSCPSKHDE
jgi:hypothetical protein